MGQFDGNGEHNEHKDGTAHSTWSVNLNKEQAKQLRAELTDTVKNGTNEGRILVQGMIHLLGLKD